MPRRCPKKAELQDASARCSRERESGRAQLVAEGSRENSAPPAGAGPARDAAAARPRAVWSAGQTTAKTVTSSWAPALPAIPRQKASAGHVAAIGETPIECGQGEPSGSIRRSCRVTVQATSASFGKLTGRPGTGSSRHRKARHALLLKRKTPPERGFREARPDGQMRTQAESRRRTTVAIRPRPARNIA